MGEAVSNHIDLKRWPDPIKINQLHRGRHTDIEQSPA